MKAVQFASYGGPEVLEVQEVEDPHAGAGQIRIAVRAAGVNPIDWKLRSGMFKDAMPVDLPGGTGMDAAGTVDEIGEGVVGVALGDEVFGTTATPAIAEYALMSEWVTKPAAMSFEEAAGIPVPAETARRVLTLLDLRAGQTLLVNGASGGVGLAAVQFATDLGASVIAISSEPHHDYLRSLGAETTTYGDGLVERVRAIAPNGVDKAFDVAGSGVIPELVELAGGADNVVTIADYAAGQYGVRVTGGGSESAPEGRQDAADLYEKGTFTMPVAETFSMADAAMSHKKSEAGHVLGKFIVTIP